MRSAAVGTSATLRETRDPENADNRLYGNLVAAATLAVRVVPAGPEAA